MLGDTVHFTIGLELRAPEDDRRRGGLPGEEDVDMHLRQRKTPGDLVQMWGAVAMLTGLIVELTVEVFIAKPLL